MESAYRNIYDGTHNVFKVKYRVIVFIFVIKL